MGDPMLTYTLLGAPPHQEEQPADTPHRSRAAIHGPQQSFR